VGYRTGSGGADDKTPVGLRALVKNIWSVAGPSTSQDVIQMLLQYFVNDNLPEGWYFTSSPIITANWEADSDKTCTVSVGTTSGRTGPYGSRSRCCCPNGETRACPSRDGIFWPLAAFSPPVGPRRSRATPVGASRLRPYQEPKSTTSGRTLYNASQGSMRKTITKGARP